MYLLLVLILLSAEIFAQNSSDYLESGTQKLRVKDISGAIVDFSKAISLDPNNELAYVSRALCRMATGNWSKAIPDCNKALSLNPNQAVALFVRGCAKANLKQNGCPDLRKSLDLGYSQASRALSQYCN